MRVSSKELFSTLKKMANHFVTLNLVGVEARIQSLIVDRRLGTGYVQPTL